MPRSMHTGRMMEQAVSASDRFPSTGQYYMARPGAPVLPLSRTAGRPPGVLRPSLHRPSKGACQCAISIRASAGQSSPPTSSCPAPLIVMRDDQPVGDEDAGDVQPAQLGAESEGLIEGREDEARPSHGHVVHQRRVRHQGLEAPAVVDLFGDLRDDRRPLHRPVVKECDATVPSS